MDKPVPVSNIPPVRFIGGTSKQGIKVNIQGAWDPYGPVEVVTDVGIPVEEALADIGTNARIKVIHL